MMRCVSYPMLIMFVMSGMALAQATGKPDATGADSQRSLQDIIGELRMLRAELRRASVNVLRSQVLIERITTQQEQVTQLRREIGEIHDRLDELRGQELKSKRVFEELKSVVEKSGGTLDDSMNAKGRAEEIEEFQNREKALVQRESALVTQLDAAQAAILALNNRLDEIEREMAQPAVGDDVQPSKQTRN